MKFWWSPGVGIWLTMETQGWGNWHLKTWKCQISRGLPGPPILGQTIDRCIVTSGIWDAFEPMWNSHNVVYNYLLRFFPWKLTSAEQQGFQVSQTQDFLSKRSDHFQKPVYIEKKKQTNKQQGSERTSKAGFGFDRNPWIARIERDALIRFLII